MSAAASRRALLGSIAALPALTMPVLAATDPHVAYRRRLHEAYASLRLARPVANVANYKSLEDDAATLVIQRAFAVADEVLDLPHPKTLDGLGVMGLALAVQYQGMASLDDGAAFPDDDRMVGIARAILAIAKEPLPDDWGGWGDEPGHFDREVAFLESGKGSLPAWALAEAQEARA